LLRDFEYALIKRYIAFLYSFNQCPDVTSSHAGHIAEISFVLINLFDYTPADIRAIEYLYDDHCARCSYPGQDPELYDCEYCEHFKERQKARKGI